MIIGDLAPLAVSWVAGLTLSRWGTSKTSIDTELLLDQAGPLGRQILA